MRHSHDLIASHISLLTRRMPIDHSGSPPFAAAVLLFLRMPVDYSRCPWNMTIVGLPLGSSVMTSCTRLKGILHQFGPLSMFSVASVHSPNKEDDTMISVCSFFSYYLNLFLFYLFLGAGW